MRLTSASAAAGAFVAVLLVPSCATSHSHQYQHFHRQHRLRKESSFVYSHANSSSNPRYEASNTKHLETRGKAKCAFPKDKGLFEVTPDALNGGWGLAPDQECVDGWWCPYSCPPGKVMNQWKPDTKYQFPESTYGGVYCKNGEIEVPFDGEPWCVEGTGAVEAVNECGEVVSFCQTMLPGYEDMIIPTDVYDSATIAVPSESYWDKSAAHYYINPPGVDSDKGCHWGDDQSPIGNWATFVAGANTVRDGSTFVKVGLNPVWLDSPLSSTKPTFGLRVECSDAGCNGLPCSVDGNGVTSNDKAIGAGGADFCVVTVPRGSRASVVVYKLDGAGGSDIPSSSYSTSEAAAPSTSSPPPVTTGIPSTTATPGPTPRPTPTPTTTSTSSISTASTSSVQSTNSFSASSTSVPSTSSESSSAPGPSSYFIGGIFQENGTATSTFSWAGPSSTTVADPSDTIEGDSALTESNKNEGAGPRQGGAAVAGLVVAVVAAIYIL